MRVQELKIRNFRNLRNFEINFDRERINVLLGKNGAAKSNLIEAIATIFSEIELGVPPSFSYFLRYECNSKPVEIDAGFSRENSLRVRAGDEAIDYDSFVNEEAPPQFPDQETNEPEEEADDENGERHRKYSQFYPSNIFIYYSGLSDRLTKVCSPVKEKYRGALRKINDPRLRRVFLTDGSHSSLILFAFLADSSEWAKKFLRERLGITSVKSVRLHLSRPLWMDEAVDPILPGCDYRYWYAGGRVLRTLRMLQRHSIPLREIAQVEKPKQGRKESDKKESSTQPELQNLHFYFNALCPPEALIEKLLTEDGFPLLTEGGGPLLLESAIRPKDLFQQLDDLRLMGYELDIHFKLEVEGVKEPISFTHLSEGEQQLLTVIGLLYFTKDNDTLFLLDEPDTHLNPQWSYEYKKMLEEAMQEGGGDSAGSSQIIMATHDPVLIAGLMKASVRIMERKGRLNGREAEAPDETEGIISASTPEENPRGMGIARILTSPMFGLRSILDEDTLNDLEDKRRLAFKKDREPEETEKLKELVRKLRDVDMTSIIEDPLYLWFVRAVVRHPDYLRLKDKLFLNTEDFADLDRIAKEVAEEMLQQVEDVE